MISIVSATATAVTTCLVLFGVVVAVGVGLGFAAHQLGRAWLASRLVRVLGVVAGLAIIVGGFWVGSAIR